MRGPAGSDHVFIYRHLPLSSTYCGRAAADLRRAVRGARHLPSAAPFLRDAAAERRGAGADGAELLGHKHVDTTLGYARLYDGTVAADYYRAIGEIESRFKVQDNLAVEPPTSGQLLALVDALRDGTLNDGQRDTLHALRAGILALAEAGNGGRACGFDMT